MPPITSNTIIIDIMRPPSDVFEFTVNPNNTPLWISFILEEQKSDEDVIVGTIYRQKIDNGTNVPGESAFIVTEVIPNKLITMSSMNGTYYCTYTYEPIEGGTRLKYFEDTGSGEVLTDPLGRNAFEKLKILIEQES